MTIIIIIVNIGWTDYLLIICHISNIWVLTISLMLFVTCTIWAGTGLVLQTAQWKRKDDPKTSATIVKQWTEDNACSHLLLSRQNVLLQGSSNSSDGWRRRVITQTDKHDGCRVLSWWEPKLSGCRSRLSPAAFYQGKVLRGHAELILSDWAQRHGPPTPSSNLSSLFLLEH